MKNALGSFALVALLLAGCGSHAASPMPLLPAPANNDSVQTVAFDDNGIADFTGATVGIRLNGESTFNSPNYGVVLGYFKGTTSLTSQVITLKAGKNVRFKNVDA